MRALLFALLLTACSASPDVPRPRQVTILWPEAHRLYVADSRQGVVRAFSTYDGPRAVAEGRAPGRHSVRDMILDPARSRLWILGRDGLYVHDAVSLALLKRLPLRGTIAETARLSLNDLGQPTFSTP